MSALALGILAALCWGVHDLCVRRVSRRAHIPSCLLVVLCAGAAAQVPLVLFAGGDPAGLGEPAVLATLLATGAAFVVASYGLYRAFEAGPVRIVAPVVGAYPIATLAFAVAGGASPGWAHWLAVPVVVGGIALVASGTGAIDTSAAEGSGPGAGTAASLAGRRDASFALASTLGWSALSAVGFATTFALGQGLAARIDPAVVSFATRLAAVAVLAACVVPARRWRRPARGDLPVLALMGGLDAVALGAVLFAGGLPDAVLASVAASLFGVVTIVLARVFLAEAMSVRQWFGVGVAFTAIGWLSAA